MSPQAAIYRHPHQQLHAHTHTNVVTVARARSHTLHHSHPHHTATRTGRRAPPRRLSRRSSMDRRARSAAARSVPARPGRLGPCIFAAAFATGGLYGGELGGGAGAGREHPAWGRPPAQRRHPSLPPLTHLVTQDDREGLGLSGRWLRARHTSPPPVRGRNIQ